MIGIRDYPFNQPSGPALQSQNLNFSLQISLKNVSMNPYSIQISSTLTGRVNYGIKILAEIINFARIRTLIATNNWALLSRSLL